MTPLRTYIAALTDERARLVARRDRIDGRMAAVECELDDLLTEFEEVEYEIEQSEKLLRALSDGEAADGAGA